MSKQQEQMSKRFDERFLKRIENSLGWSLPRIAYFWEQSGKDVEWEDMEVELKSFIQSEIDLAVAEKQNILEMIIKDIQGFSPDGEIGTLCEQALSLITKEN